MRGVRVYGTVWHRRRRRCLARAGWRCGGAGEGGDES